MQLPRHAKCWTEKSWHHQRVTKWGTFGSNVRYCVRCDLKSYLKRNKKPFGYVCEDSGTCGEDLKQYQFYAVVSIHGHVNKHNYLGCFFMNIFKVKAFCFSSHVLWKREEELQCHTSTGGPKGQILGQHLGHLKGPSRVRDPYTDDGLTETSGRRRMKGGGGEVLLESSTD